MSNVFPLLYLPNGPLSHVFSYVTIGKNDRFLPIFTIKLIVINKLYINSSFFTKQLLINLSIHLLSKQEKSNSSVSYS